MTDVTTPPTLPEATDEEIFAEIGKRFHHYLFLGRTVRDGKAQIGRYRMGDPYTLFGMLHAAEVEARLEFIQAVPKYQNVNDYDSKPEGDPANE